MEKKLIVGTVQFGLDYGITNNSGKIKEKLTSATPIILVSETPLPPVSIIIPCSIGNRAPPTIAITNPADPTLACSSVKSFNAIP